MIVRIISVLLRPVSVCAISFVGWCVLLVCEFD
jgi:hypothetical protein